jgi:hypothetical protein
MKPRAFTARDYPIGAAVDMPRAGARIDDEHKLPAGGQPGEQFFRLAWQDRPVILR